MVSAIQFSYNRQYFITVLYNPHQHYHAPYRLGLLEEWRGIRDEELSKLSGIPGCIFVHASGFIGGNINREGALEMARVTLRHAREKQS